MHIFFSKGMRMRFSLSLFSVIAIVFCFSLVNLSIGAEPGFSNYSTKIPAKLSLSDCLDIAISHQPKLVSTRESITVAKAQLLESKSAYLPQVNVSSNYSRSKSDSLESSNSYNNSGSVSQLVYDFGRTPASIRQAEENVFIQELTYLLTELQILLDVKSAYFNILQALENVRIAQETLNNSNLHLKLAETQYTVGKAAKVDVAKAQVEVANAELTLVTANNNYTVSIRLLNNVMGLDANTYTEVELAQTPYSSVTAELPHLILMAIRDRPDVRIFQNEREQIKSSLLAAERGHFPTISAGASYSASGSNFPLESSWAGQLGMSFTLFNGFKTEGQVQENKANLRSLDAQEQTMIQAVQLDVTTNYLNTKSDEEKIKAAQQLVDQAKESLRLATGRYENGLGSILDLTDAQVSYSNARVSLAQAIHDFQTDYAKLQKSLGQK